MKLSFTAPLVQCELKMRVRVADIGGGIASHIGVQVSVNS